MLEVLGLGIKARYTRLRLEMLGLGLRIEILGLGVNFRDISVRG